MKEYKYLSFMLEKNWGTPQDNKHLRERKRKATIATKKAWSIGERIFSNNFGRRVKLFKAWRYMMQKSGGGELEDE